MKFFVGTASLVGLASAVVVPRSTTTRNATFDDLNAPTFVIRNAQLPPIVLPPVVPIVTSIIVPVVTSLLPPVTPVVSVVTSILYPVIPVVTSLLPVITSILPPVAPVISLVSTILLPPVLPTVIPIPTVLPPVIPIPTILPTAITVPTILPTAITIPPVVPIISSILSIKSSIDASIISVVSSVVSPIIPVIPNPTSVLSSIVSPIIPVIPNPTSVLSSVVSSIIPIVTSSIKTSSIKTSSIKTSSIKTSSIKTSSIKSVTTSAPTAKPTQVGVYDDLAFNAFDVIRVANPATAPIQPQSGLNVAINGKANNVRSAPSITSANDHTSFDFQGLYFGCVSNTVPNVFGAAVSCTVTMTAYKANDPLTPLGSYAVGFIAKKTSNPMVHVKFPATWTKLYKVKFSVSSSAVANADTAIVLDNVGYVVHM